MHLLTVLTTDQVSTEASNALPWTSRTWDCDCQTMIQTSASAGSQSLGGKQENKFMLGKRCHAATQQRAADCDAGSQEKRNCGKHVELIS